MIVGTEKKSIAAIASRWLRRKASQRFAGSGFLGARFIQREIVRSETSKPSLRSSPWIRGAPHVGFSRTMRKINPRTSFGVCLLPFGFLTFEISLQYSRKPVRCQRTTVSGETTHAQFVFALVRSARPSVPSPWERRSRELGSSPAAHRPEAARSSAQPQPPPPTAAPQTRIPIATATKTPSQLRHA